MFHGRYLMNTRDYHSTTPLLSGELVLKQEHETRALALKLVRRIIMAFIVMLIFMLKRDATVAPAVSFSLPEARIGPSLTFPSRLVIWGQKWTQFRVPALPILHAIWLVSLDKILYLKLSSVSHVTITRGAV